MIDIVPTKTQKSCGNSSIELLRRNFQNFVTLGSFLILNNGPDLSFLLIKSFFKSSAFCTIERNFKNVNSFPFLPTLFCLNKTGHLLSILINIDIISINGDKMIIQQIEMMISHILFQTIFHQSNVEYLYSIATRFEIVSGL